MNKICILGSINMDLVIKVKNMPKVGETILSKSFEKIAGGKGSNQAVAAKRCGNRVSMIGKVGQDDNGEILKNLLDKEKIDTELIFEDTEYSTGMAMITVDEKSENSIVVISGANMNLNSNEVESARGKIKESDILIAQFETPEEATIKAFNIAKEYGKITILNPAPARKIESGLLGVTDIIIPNEIEAEVLTGMRVTDLETAKIAGQELLKNGIKVAIITLGEKGVAIITKEKAELIKAFKVDAIDTTAAGDSFIGGLSYKLNVENFDFENLRQAAIFGCKVSSIAVQREGAQPSIPTLEEIINVYGEE